MVFLYAHNGTFLKLVWDTHNVHVLFDRNMDHSIWAETHWTNRWATTKMNELIWVGIWVTEKRRRTLGPAREEIGRAHGEFFKEIKPASTMVEVSRFIDEKILIEIEVSAVISE